MANAEAWNLGWQTGTNLAGEQRLRKEQLSDEDRRRQADDLISQRQVIALKPGLSDDERLSALTKVQTGLEQLYHPIHAPGALQKDWQYLKQLVMRKKPVVPASTEIPATTAADTTIKPDAVTLPSEPGVPGGPMNLPGSEVTIPGTSQPRVVPAAATLTPYQRKVQAQKDRAASSAKLFAMGAPATPEEEEELEGRKTLAHFRTLIEGYKATGATPAQVAEFTSQLYEKEAGVAAKPVWKEFVSADGKSKTYFDVTKGIPPGWNATGGGSNVGGLKFDTATGQIAEPSTGKRYTDGDPSNPPEVARMFLSQRMFAATKQAFQEQMMRERGFAYGTARQMAPMTVLDTANGNAPVSTTYQDMMREPGRYIPASEGDKAIAGKNLFEDIARSSRALRGTINNLSPDEAFDEPMKAKIAVALTADDHGGALNALVASNALGTLTPNQFKFLVAARQMTEQAMAMRGVLGVGQSSDSVREAIQATLPSLLTPSRDYALIQLDQFDQVLTQLHGGIKNVPLNQTPWSVQSGSAPPAPGGAVPKGTTHIKKWTDPATGKVRQFYIDNEGKNLGEKLQ